MECNVRYFCNDCCDYTITEEERGTEGLGHKAIDDEDTGGKINSCAVGFPIK